MTWFRYSCEYRRYSREDSGVLITASFFRRGNPDTPTSPATIAGKFLALPTRLNIPLVALNTLIARCAASVVAVAIAVL